VTLRTDAKGQQIVYTYDGFGNLTAKIVTKGTGLTSFSATYDALTNHAVGGNYDANGNLLKVAVTNPYDVENRLIPATAFVDVDAGRWTYDPWGKRIGWRLPHQSGQF